LEKNAFSEGSMIVMRDWPDDCSGSTSKHAPTAASGWSVAINRSTFVE
jgi:hypothetical protein